MFVAGSTTDDVIPYAQVRPLAVDWCGQGATVHLDTLGGIPSILSTLAVGHVLAALPIVTTMADWITDQIAGVPASSDCEALTS